MLRGQLGHLSFCSHLLSGRTCKSGNAEPQACGKHAKHTTSSVSLQSLHAAGLVHRDVKPANIIFSEVSRKFKLIDLGACADLRSGTNYIPDESILDPMYCPPEQVRWPGHI